MRHRTRVPSQKGTGGGGAGLKPTKRAARLGCTAGLIAVLVVGCTPAPKEYATQIGKATDQSTATFSGCLKEIRTRPQYASLLPHVNDLDTGQPTMAQLTDEAIPSLDDAHLLAARFDATNACRTNFMNDLSNVRPDLVVILADAFTKREEVVVLLVEQKITWAEAARRTRATANDMQQKIAAANRQWVADVAAHRSDNAQRHAATVALMRWSAEQQVLDAVNSH